MRRRVSTNLPSNMKFLIITLPTGKIHLPLSTAKSVESLSGGVHDARSAPASPRQSKTWILPPAGRTNARVLAALSDQRGLLTSYGWATVANWVGFACCMHPVRLSWQIGTLRSAGRVHVPGVAGVMQSVTVASVVVPASLDPALLPVLAPDAPLRAPEPPLAPDIGPLPLAPDFVPLAPDVGAMVPVPPVDPLPVVPPPLD